MSGMISFERNGVQVTGYLAEPTGTPKAGLIVIQEWWGLNDDIKGIADRYAREGYLAFSPDLYHGTVAGEPDEAQKLAMALERNVAGQEIHAAIAWLKDERGVAKVGCTGFCMGGGLTLTTATLPTSRVDAVHVYYGAIPSEGEVEAIRVPVMGSFGAEDTYISADQVERMRQQLVTNGIATDIHSYTGAGHSFFNAGPAHHEASAQDSWRRSLEWWSRYLN